MQKHVSKYQQFDVKLYVLLREDQLESLARLTREIMKNRPSEHKTERITKNTILRALIGNLKGAAAGRSLHSRMKLS